MRTTTLNLGPREEIHINLTSLLRTLRLSGESWIQIRWICTGWIPSGWWAMQGDFKSPSLFIKRRFAKGVQRNITDFFKAWITTDGIKIFSITFCTLVTVYCTCKIAKDAFRIVLYVTTFYVQHCVQYCAVACFVLEQWFFYDCTYVPDMYNVVCYWKTVSLYCELINLNVVERRAL